MSTPANPDNDTVDDPTHGGESEQDASGRTPDNPDNDMPDGGADSAS